MLFLVVVAFLLDNSLQKAKAAVVLMSFLVSVFFLLLQLLLDVA